MQLIEKMNNKEQDFLKIWNASDKDIQLSLSKSFLNNYKDLNYLYTINTIGVKYTYGYSLLHIACFNRNIKLIRFLLNKGIDVNLNIDGGTALHKIITDLGKIENKYEIINLLLNAGTNLDFIYKNTWYPQTCFLAAIHYADMRVVEMLNDSNSSSCFDSEIFKKRALLTACHNNVDFNVFLYCIEKYPDFETLDEDNGTLLFNVYSDVRKTKRILEYKKVNINHVNNEGNSALHNSVENEISNFIDGGYGMNNKNSLLLYQNGININLRNNENETAYDLAIDYGGVELAEKWYDFLK